MRGYIALQLDRRSADTPCSTATRQPCEQWRLRNGSSFPAQHSTTAREATVDVKPKLQDDSRGPATSTAQPTFSPSYRQDHSGLTRHRHLKTSPFPAQCVAVPCVASRPCRNGRCRPLRLSNLVRDSSPRVRRTTALRRVRLRTSPAAH